MKNKFKSVFVIVLAVVISSMAFIGCDKISKTEPTRYTVTFESNGGSAVESVTQDEGTQIVAPDAPEKTGAVFYKWYYDEEFSQAVAFPFILQKSLTLYARWSLTATVSDSFFENAVRGGETVVLTEDTGTVISKNAIQSIKESETPVKIKLPSGLEIVIDPVSVSDDTTSLDLNIELDVIKVAKEAVEGEMFIDDKSVVIKPSATGEFGLALSLTIPAQTFIDANINIYEAKLWHISSGGVVSQKGTLTVNQDGDAVVTISGASSYVLSKYEPYLYVVIDDTPEWNFEDLNSVKEAIGNNNVSFNIVYDFDEEHEKFDGYTDSEAMVAGTTITETVKGRPYIYIKEDNNYYYYTTSKSSGYKDWCGSVINQTFFDNKHFTYTGAIPLILNKEYYDYDLATKTYTMKSEYVELVLSIPYDELEGYYEGVTITLENDKLVVSFIFTHGTAKVYVWNVGKTLEPVKPELKLDLFDGAAPLTLDTKETVTNGQPYYFTFTPQTSLSYTMKIYDLGYDGEEKTLEYTVRDEDGFSICGDGYYGGFGWGGSNDGSGWVFSVQQLSLTEGETYYISFRYTRSGATSIQIELTASK